MDCEPVDFAKAGIAGEGGARELEVTVEGVGASDEILLQPYVYIMQPEYWAIGVVACKGSGASQAAGRTVVVRMSLAGTIGRKGIEVVGGPASEIKRFELR